MELVISNASNLPIYEQIVTQLRRRIVSGELSPGEMLPSIRALAKDLRISVITTKRAYEELEREGLIVSAAGKGCFVAAKNTELLREENLKCIEEHMQEIRRLAAGCGLSRGDIIEMFNVLEEELP